MMWVSMLVFISVISSLFFLRCSVLLYKYFYFAFSQTGKLILKPRPNIQWPRACVRPHLCWLFLHLWVLLDALRSFMIASAFAAKTRTQRGLFFLTLSLCSCYHWSCWFAHKPSTYFTHSECLFLFLLSMYFYLNVSILLVICLINK